MGTRNPLAKKKNKNYKNDPHMVCIERRCEKAPNHDICLKV